MAIKGTIAKQNFINSIKHSNPSAFVGESGGKYYFWAEENGEKVQLAVSLTCPKVPLEVTAPTYIPKVNDGFDFENAADIPEAAPVTEVSKEEQENINLLLKQLGL